MMKIRIKQLELSNKRFFVLRFTVALFLILFALFSLSPFPPPLARLASGGFPLSPNPAFAALYVQSNCTTQTLNPRVEGLISANYINNGFGNPTGACIVGTPAQFRPDGIPAYATLYSKYYTQSKATKNPVDNSANPAIAAVTNNTVYSYTESVYVGSLNYNGTAVVFVDKDLYIGGNITGTAGSGLVFVVQGDPANFSTPGIIIADTVTRIDAVLISSGTIYTAGTSGTGCATNGVTTNQLTIYGSLISLNPSNPIKFCRTLSNNNNPAEVINQQPKYLVILKDLFSETYQKWSELETAPTPAPTAAPTPTPVPTPAPTPTPPPACLFGGDTCVTGGTPCCSPYFCKFGSCM